MIEIEVLYAYSLILALLTTAVAWFYTFVYEMKQDRLEENE